MNQNGFLFTFMALLVILSIMALNSSIKNAESDNQKFFEITKLISANNKFDNIKRSAIDFKKTGLVKQYTERILPFSYNIDGNLISVSQNIPLNSNDTNGFFDFINLYEILLKDPTYGSFDNLAVDVNTIKNSAWGGNDKSLHFLIEPFCYQFTVEDLGKSLFEQSTSGKCSGTFDYARTRRLDANVVIKNSVEDLNRISCNGGACPSNPYSAANPLPYYRIVIDDSNCGNCYFPQKTISNHFNPNSDLNISIFCQGTGCVSKGIDFLINKSFSVSRKQDSNYPVSIGLAVSFDSNVEQFLFLDFNVSVKNQDFGITKTNNPQAVS